MEHFNISNTVTCLINNSFQSPRVQKIYFFAQEIFSYTFPSFFFYWHPNIFTFSFVYGTIQPKNIKRLHEKIDPYLGKIIALSFSILVVFGSFAWKNRVDFSNFLWNDCKKIPEFRLIRRIFTLLYGVYFGYKFFQSASNNSALENANPPLATENERSDSTHRFQKLHMIMHLAIEIFKNFMFFSAAYFLFSLHKKLFTACLFFGAIAPKQIEDAFDNMKLVANKTSAMGSALLATYSFFALPHTAMVCYLTYATKTGSHTRRLAETSYLQLKHLISQSFST